MLGSDTSKPFQMKAWGLLHRSLCARTLTAEPACEQWRAESSKFKGWHVRVANTVTLAGF